MATAIVTISGNVGGNVENRVTPSGHENIQFSVAVNDRRGGNESTAWYRCTAWGATAKGLTTLAQNGGFASGAQVIVNGTLRPREFTDRNGQQRMSLDVDASSVDIVKYAGDRNEPHAPANRPYTGEDEPVSMDSIPF